jgi:hypothetical protein
MKKYFIIAAVAMVAMASCTKTLTDETAVQNDKIAFEVANYAQQTKADVAITNAEDGIFSFHTYAYQFPQIGTPVTFMSNVEILPWNISGTTTTQVTAANFASTNITSWAPEYDYYWPKTGYVNFYSYAGSHTPAVAVNSDSDWKTVTYTYTDAVIGATSNILVAKPALHYGVANAATETYDVDNSEGSGHVTKGVPTLFRHQLAKVKFDVRARTTDANISANTTWKVQVLGTYTYTPNGGSETTIKSAINPVNKGSLLLTCTDANTSAGTVEWVKTNESAANISGWVASTAAADKDELVFTETSADIPAVMTIPAGAIESVDASNNNAPYDAIEILALRSVLPQVTSGVNITMVYKVQAFHGDSKFMEEIRTVGIDADADLADFTGFITSWQANKKITYHIIIDPVSQKVTFDPAVEEYDPIDADGAAHADNEHDDPNINQGGII